MTALLGDDNQRYDMPEPNPVNRCCDLVMKGGITSGILYPAAVRRIAERFHLVGIGGTSAGAIASCVAAAAEYRRRCGGGMAGYEALEKIPQELAAPGNLTGLFRPDGETRKLHGLFLDLLRFKQLGWLTRLWLMIRVVWLVIRRNAKLRPMVSNGLGLCSGMANGNTPPAGEILPLTAWLHARIEEAAGSVDSRGAERVRPLTFGDLWDAPAPPALRDTLLEGEERSIDLRAVTTCLSFGRPYELPFEDRVFAFDPVEWKRLFPKMVMDYLEAEAAKIDAPTLRRDGKLPLPVGRALPIVVAARMSLSFPGLFAMVPLHAVDYEASQGADGQWPMKRVWFSDGGITSNLPIHRFDNVLPRWPTFGINLQYTGADGRPARSSVDDSLVYMIARRSEGVRDLWHVFADAGSPMARLLGFAGAIFRSAQVWHDNAFLRLPSYRDRIVEIWLTPDEGGLNLSMSSETIQRLIERGNEAGTRIRDRFAEEPDTASLSWGGHRWTRLRSGMSGLVVQMRRIKRAMDHPMPGDVPVSSLLESRDAAPAYKFESQRQLEEAREAIEGLLALVEKSMEAGRSCVGEQDRPFCKGPKPAVEMGSRAPM